ncbi:hypothetical protein, partial [Nocardia asiatica]|uniref:hypothetical protein n=1 Tax=Nocardia asiatica TaxID=209252 RepID=UPI001C3F24D3
MVAARAYLGPLVLAEEVGLQRWQFDRAADAGLLPPRGHARGWLPDQVEQVRALVPTIVRRWGAEHPLGATRCAERLAERLDLPVQAYDIKALAGVGQLRVAWAYNTNGRSHDLYFPAEVDALAPEAVEAVITEREAWMVVSLDTEQACELLGWKREELLTVAARRQLERGPLGRWRRADVEALAADAELVERVRLARLLTADEAAEVLAVARRHFDIAVEAEWVRPVQHHGKRVGRSREVRVPLYATKDVLALLQRPEIDWERVRACPKGQPSPLLELVGGRKSTRAKAIRSFLRRFGDEHGIEMWGWWAPAAEVWEIDWERVDGGPEHSDVEAAIAADATVRAYREDMQLHSAAGRAIRFARRMLTPGVAVILDTETTDLQ